MRYSLTAATCVLFLLALTGCPADDETQNDPDASSGTNGRSGAGADDVCDAYAAYEVRCATPDAGGEPVASWAETECPTIAWHYVEPAYTQATSACLTTLPCDGSDDACTGEGLAALGIRDEADVADDALFQRCGDRARVCDYLDDLCLLFVTFSDEGRAAAAGCLDRPCPEVEACLRDP